MEEVQPSFKQIKNPSFFVSNLRLWEEAFRKAGEAIQLDQVFQLAKNNFAGLMSLKLKAGK